MKKGSAPLHIDRKSCHLTLDNVPAWICSQCGEAYFEENEVNHIHKALKKIDFETLALTSKIA